MLVAFHWEYMIMNKYSWTFTVSSQIFIIINGSDTFPAFSPAYIYAVNSFHLWIKCYTSQINCEMSWDFRKYPKMYGPFRTLTMLRARKKAENHDKLSPPSWPIFIKGRSSNICNSKQNNLYNLCTSFLVCSEVCCQCSNNQSGE